MINEKMSIEEAITNKPELISYFEKIGLDFCCGGKRNLGEAILEKNYILEDTIKEINEYKEINMGNDLDQKIILNKVMNFKINELIEYIIHNHHRKEEKLIEEVDLLLNKILRVHYVSHGKNLSEIYSTYLILKGELASHFAKEEKIIFPMFKDADNMSIRELEDEHEKAGDLLKKLEILTNNFIAPKDGCNTYKLAFSRLKELIEDIHMHIFIENSILFKEQ